MWQAQLLPPSHYESHEFQFQDIVEVLHVELEGYEQALSLEENVELLVLAILLWVLAEACDQFE